MEYHNIRNFSTADQFNYVGKYEYNCAKSYKAAWWYGYCAYAHLNGLYNAKRNGIWWNTFSPQINESLTWTEMKVRPTDFISAQKFHSMENEVESFV